MIRSRKKKIVYRVFSIHRLTYELKENILTLDIILNVSWLKECFWPEMQRILKAKKFKN